MLKKSSQSRLFHITPPVVPGTTFDAKQLLPVAYSFCTGLAACGAGVQQIITPDVVESPK
jgi:hypothetical protein